MPKTRKAPTVACPKCGQAIHAAKRSHDCGWTKSTNGVKAKAAKATPPANGRADFPHGYNVAGGSTAIDVLDIADQIKMAVERLGADAVCAIAERYRQR